MFNSTNTAGKFARITALAGSILTLVQILLLANDREGICLNDGCEIVDSLTTIPPVFFNIGGFIFFQAVFWGLWIAGKDKRYLGAIKLLLLAALAAEAVLLYFQHAIAETFCSYCLIVFALVVILNICCGMKQILSGGVIFLSVIVAMSTLQFSSGNTISAGDLDRGTMALVRDGSDEKKRYLFFSSDCRYCERVIQFVEKNRCPVRFNPIEKIDSFSVQGAEPIAGHRAEINRKFLNGLQIQQIPVLVTVDKYGFSVVKGEQSITGQLLESCTVKNQPKVPPEDFTPQGTLQFLPPALDDSCSVNSDCDDPLNLTKPKEY